MRPEDRDAAHIWDAIEAGKAIALYVNARTFDDYLADSMLRAAVERQLTIIGEATKRMSEAFRGAHPEIEWRSIIGLRNVLMHEYDEIDQNRIFVIATDFVPRLVSRLRVLLPEIPSDPEPREP